MKPVVVALGALLALSASLARAQEYGVSGHDAAGRARVDGERLRVDLVTFARGNTSRTQALVGKVVSRDARTLRWTYDRLVEVRG